jgi:hypothetical protein
MTVWPDSLQARQNDAITRTEAVVNAVAHKPGETDEDPR